MEDKRTKFKKKFGKPSTVRSVKKRFTQKKEEPKIDDDTLDQNMYLGVNLKELEVLASAYRESQAKI